MYRMTAPLARDRNRYATVSLEDGRKGRSQGGCAESQGGVYLGALFDCIHLPIYNLHVQPQALQDQKGNETDDQNHTAPPTATLGCSDA